MSGSAIGSCTMAEASAAGSPVLRRPLTPALAAPNGSRRRWGNQVHPKMKSMNVLFLGENWFGSCARACCYALRRLGCTVLDIDQQPIFGRWQSRWLRAGRFLLLRTMVAEYNSTILKWARHWAPDLVIAFKGTHVLPTTVRHLREMRIPVYNYFPDVRVSGQMQSALREYSCVFDTKVNRRADDSSGWRRRVLLEHGYDADIYNAVALNQAERESLGSDVSFIGTFDPRKGMLMSAIIREIPSVRLRIWGNGWRENCRERNLERSIEDVTAEGAAFPKVVAATAINMGLLTGSCGPLDEATTRSYEIPACGGFMLHERTPAIREIYREDEEFVAFSRPKELVWKVRHFLASTEERSAIAAAGYRRAVPAYSYDVRMRALLEWHLRHAGQVVE